MNWESISAFLAMGGYAAYVWGSYFAAGLCIALEIGLLSVRHRRLWRGLHRD